MANTETFEVLETHHKRKKIIKKFYKVLKYKRFQRNFNLVGQIKRFPVSIVNNLTEGIARYINTTVSNASAEIPKLYLYIIANKKYYSEKNLKTVHLSSKISKFFQGLISYLKPPKLSNFFTIKLKWEEKWNIYFIFL